MSRSTPPLEVRIVESPPALAADVVELFMLRAQQAAKRGAAFRVALSGGSTPRLMYGLLASDTFRNEVPWANIQFFFGDERWVPPTSRESNYKLANDELFKKVPVGSYNIFPISTVGVTPDESAQQYEASLREAFQSPETAVPSFDLIFLGMGDDGHTASLFPHSEALKEHTKLVAPNYVEKLAAQRITLTAPVLQAAKEVVFLVTGEAKAPALKQILEGELNVEEYPSQLLREASGQVVWYLDRAAASQLESEYTMA